MCAATLPSDRQGPVSSERTSRTNLDCPPSAWDTSIKAAPPGVAGAAHFFTLGVGMTMYDQAVVERNAVGPGASSHSAPVS